MSAKIELINNGISKALSGVAGKIKAARPLMIQISGVMADSAESNFAAQGRPKWKQLSKARIKQRKRKGSWPGYILQDSGRLAASVQQKATDTEAVVSTNVKYAAIQQLGGTVKIPAHESVIHFKKFKSGKRKGKVRFSKEGNATFAQKARTEAYTITIPARPFLTVTPHELVEIRKLVNIYVKTGIE